WTAHEPPTLTDRSGRDVGRLNPFSRSETMAQGIGFQHYAYVLESQVRFKEAYYGYKGAVAQWRALQKSRGMIRPADFLDWAGSDAWAQDWPEGKGRLLLYDLLRRMTPPTNYRSISVSANTRFEKTVRRLVAEYRPHKIIETGTYLGRGTTTILWRALQAAGITEDVDFTTIEVNPEHHRQASDYFKIQGMTIRAELGLSLPRGLLPDKKQIESEFVRNKRDDIYYDHSDSERSERYLTETDFDVRDDLLSLALQRCDNRPDLILLDSAGHLGIHEFNLVRQRVKGPCHIILDDTHHCKHHLSMEAIRRDPRFEIIEESDEKFGFAVVKFTPVQSLIFARTDSIGDNILAGAMLPELRKHFSGANIHLVCQEQVAELFENCPYVDGILTIPNEHQWKEAADYESFRQKVRRLEPDLLINSVYSEHELSDPPGMEFIPRHRLFLTKLGIDTETSFIPEVWLSNEDRQFAQDIFKRHELDPHQTVVLFAGARTAIKQYQQWGIALADICKRHELRIIALGAEKDRLINQRQLEQLPYCNLNLCGQTSLRQAAAILKEARLAVGSDTSLAHMACAVGTDNVILLGGGHFGRFLPYSQHTSVICLPLDCYGCDWRCVHARNHCITDIRPQSIAAAVEFSLANPSAGPCVFAQQVISRTIDEGGSHQVDIRRWIDTGRVKLKNKNPFGLLFQLLHPHSIKRLIWKHACDPCLNKITPVSNIS
ncbi:MAG: glycosyltransferase family 9 protein, partial [Desulfosarcinaceae bacterium]